MATFPNNPHGMDLLLQEFREEVGRFVHHPLGEMKRLEQVAEEGDSATTPLLLGLAVTAVIAAVVALVIAFELGSYYAG
jgi:hypothetical protein